MLAALMEYPPSNFAPVLEQGSVYKSLLPSLLPISLPPLRLLPFSDERVCTLERNFWIYNQKGEGKFSLLNKKTLPLFPFIFSNQNIS